MPVENGRAHIGNGNGCARKEMMSSTALGKKGAGICSDEVWKPVETCSRRKVTETNLKNDVLSTRNVFCQKKSEGIERCYSREEMEALRFEILYQQRQIWREIYTGFGPVVAKELNLLAEARQNGNAIINRQQQQPHHQPQLQDHHQPQQHNQHPRQSLQHQQYPQQQQQYHQHPEKPPQHHPHHNHHQHQQSGENKENASILDNSFLPYLNMESEVLVCALCHASQFLLVHHSTMLSGFNEKYRTY
ncbi:hypothetical protein MKW94_020142 [Papaver nudicaule]|uniref:Uncharacterized protein n=1 Tax=Papaver nudicaule TaxID=74823 RepID=A0AA41UZU2_PAPNU|nr:hypothetical protein [Papaver nudicaule]